MIHAPTLTADLKKEVTALEADLHRRLKDEPDFKDPLKARYDEVFKSGRTAATFIAWAEGQITQSAVAWALATVFVRFLEDNRFLPDPILSGPDARRGLAQDALAHHFTQQPGHSERDYLLHHFAALRRYPALTELLGPHNALHSLHPSADALKRLLAFWQALDPASGLLRHDFTDAAMNTRFLGDLYQDLSESARKTFALLQTPEFIESFILDRTLTPALREFGLPSVRLIDPTCGSGHFVLGAFRRLFDLWIREGASPREAAINALAAVHGVDLNPFAIAISRFRLTIEACHLCNISRLADAPDFLLNLATGDSLLHGRRFTELGSGIGSQRSFDIGNDFFRDELKHHYEVEDAEALHRILGQQYHAVVGNPPYITVKDSALSELYRARYKSCHRQYSLSVPFMERFFDLAVKGDGTGKHPAGFTGQITGNAFMKREFGKKLIEEYLPRWDLTHVIDTAGAYIPGHGTPTVILFGKNQAPVGGTIRTVLGICGEPTKPIDPAHGLVWQAISRQIDAPGSESGWVSSADSKRSNFHTHPWSIGGGGIRELHDAINLAAKTMLGDETETICSVAYTRLDEAYLLTREVLNRQAVLVANQIEFVSGDNVRDWAIVAPVGACFPYDSELKPAPHNSGRGIHQLLWPFREDLWRRREINGDHRELNRTWWEWNRFLRHRFREPNSITFAETATHNNFVSDDKRRVFSQTAPVIKPKLATPASFCFCLTGLLNSAVGCFWLKQVCHSKGGGGVNEGLRGELWERFFQINATKVAAFPIPSHQPTQTPTVLVHTSTAQQNQTPTATLASWSGSGTGDLHAQLAGARSEWHRLRRQMIALQEELDWQIYESYKLIESSDRVNLPEGAAMDAIPPDGIQLGERAFEIVLARRMAAGDVQTTWFERHGSTPITEIPAHWPTAYRELVERRIQRIADDPNIRLIEQPEYKRRWNTEPWDEQFQTAAQQWLLVRLETYAFDSERMDGADATVAQRQSWAAGLEPKVFSLAQLAAVAETDAALKEVMEAWTGTPAFDLHRQLKGLLEGASVPFLPVQRYKEPGLRKRQAWEETWALQRREDAVEARIRTTSPDLPETELTARIRDAQQAEVGPIAVPPKYASSDFKKSVWWSLRGKLDVPKERWIAYPALESDSAPSPLYAWAGWNHLQQARALAALYVERKDTDGWPPARLTPILAGLADLVPWLQQWHNDIDPEFGERLGNYFASFLDDERRSLSLTPDDLDRARLG
jgi:hypothetical protein